MGAQKVHLSAELASNEVAGARMFPHHPTSVTSPSLLMGAVVIYLQWRYKNRGEVIPAGPTSCEHKWMTG